jgi:hypothetical protein
LNEIRKPEKTASRLAPTKVYTPVNEGSILTTADGTQLPKLPNGGKWIRIEHFDWKGIEDELPFRKASASDISTMLKVFEEDVLPLLNRSGSVTLSKLYALDRKDGRTQAPWSRAFAYEFLVGIDRGSDVIAVTGKGRPSRPPYEWLSGRHRAFIARRLGWKFVPARVAGEGSE